jgi:hypothetical protein
MRNNEQPTLFDKISNKNFKIPRPKGRGFFISAAFDLDELRDMRRSWGVFRDRRPEMYQILMTHGSA